MSADYFETLEVDVRERYKRKLTLVGLDLCPYQLPAELWKCEPTEWPPLEFPELHYYLTETPGKEIGHCCNSFYVNS